MPKVQQSQKREKQKKKTGQRRGGETPLKKRKQTNSPRDSPSLAKI
jgi:hypothetical protein